MEKADKQAAVTTDNNKLITVVFIPLLSVLTWLFFKRAGYNYAENLVLNVLINGQLIVLFLIICIIPVLIKTSLIVLVMYLYIFISWLYAMVAYKQFFRQGWGWTILKGSAIQIVYIIIVTYSSSAVMNYLE